MSAWVKTLVAFLTNPYRFVRDLLARKQWQTAAAEFSHGEPRVVIGETGVEIATCWNTIHWSLLPHVKVNRTIAAARSLPQLFAAMTQYSLNRAWNDLQAGLVTAFREENIFFNTHAFKHALSIWSAGMNQACEAMLQQYESGPQGENGRRAVAILQQVVDTTLKNFKLGLMGDAEKIIRGQTDRLVRRIEQLATVWVNQLPTLDNRAVVFPKGTIYCVQKGLAKIAIVADDPQVRLVFLDKTLLPDPPVEVNRRNIAENSLAMPHMVYAVKTVNDAFSALHVYFAKSTPVSLDDPLYKCVLPNTDPGSCSPVCLGALKFNSTNFAGRIAEAIGYY